MAEQALAKHWIAVVAVPLAAAVGVFVFTLFTGAGFGTSVFCGLLVFGMLFTVARWALRAPRLTAWNLATVVLWLLGFLVVIGKDGRNIRATYQLALALAEPANRGHLWPLLVHFFAGDYSDFKPPVFFHAWLALWVVLALLRLLQLGNKPLNWMDFRKFRWVFICALACAGYPGASFTYALLDTLDPDPVLTVLRLLAPPFLLPLVGFLTVLALGISLAIATWIFRLVLITLPLMVFDYLNERDIASHIRNQKKIGISNFLYRFHHWLRGEALPDVPDDSKGARFASDREVMDIYNPDGMGFGHYSGATLRIATDKHVLIMASTRSGKGVTLIIPHLLRYQGSAFVLDPKGENARATGRQRAALNSQVHYLDPFGISGKPQSRFNPLAHFKPETMEAQSKTLAAALIIETTRDHWTSSAQQLLAALILFVVASPFPPERKSLVTVRKLLLGAVKISLKEMSESELLDGLLADLAASFLSTPERELGSIISTAQRETEILDNPAIVACLSATGDSPEVDFADFHNGTMSVFLCLSAPKFPVFNRWLRLVLTAALDEMTDKLNPPPLPVCFMLDELAALGHLGAIENAIGLAAGYGVTLVCVFQDVAQMRDLYKGRWASFVGNAGVRALFSLDDYETAEYWSKFIGGHLVATSSETRDTWGLAQGSSAGESMRALLSPDEIMMRYAQGLMLVLKQGSRPIESARVPYWNDPSLAGLWDDPRMR